MEFLIADRPFFGITEKSQMKPPESHLSQLLENFRMIPAHFEMLTNSGIATRPFLI